MAARETDRTEVAIIGAGLAGIAAALELLEAHRSVLLLERDSAVAAFIVPGHRNSGTPQPPRGCEGADGR